ncbi:hypothetical protein NL108_002691 [Boleophthalmus pectinirostris]|nr:hypothetical protein NL108_002691 [Boleophthalmus pectinirostris]
MGPKSSQSGQDAGRASQVATQGPRDKDLDHLLGGKPNKFRPLATCNTMSRAHMYSTASYYSSEQPRPSCSSYSQHYPKSHYHSLSGPLPDLSYPLCPPYSQHVSPPRCLKMPPAYSEALHDGHSGRSMYDLLLDGDTGCDVDTLNPSLTDLQLQGSLWEELKEDSARVVPSLSPSTVETITEQSSYLQPTVSSTLEDVTSSNKAHYVDKDADGLWGQDQNYLNGYPLGVYSGMESFAGTLSSCATSVSLI